ncbi:hypothetical protein JCGZ_09991 [Jatropha curcas]|uniref:Uncharacterized protein n=1 Tax=Jatropha curcas TaxID=180498 RepID=A0A067KUR8_JATCU|nr:hypothetical protein JCGZ_09991 [Jatropha curcas]
MVRKSSLSNRMRSTLRAGVQLKAFSFMVFKFLKLSSDRWNKGEALVHESSDSLGRDGKQMGLGEDNLVLGIIDSESDSEEEIQLIRTHTILTEQGLEGIRARCFIPAEYTMRISPARMRANARLDCKTLIVYMEDCRVGVRFPLPRILSSFCNEWERGGEDHPHLKAHKDCNLFPLKSSSVKGRWKGKYFLIGHPNGFGIPTQWSQGVPRLRRPRDLTIVKARQVKTMRQHALNPPPLLLLLDSNIPVGARSWVSRKRKTRETEEMPPRLTKEMKEHMPADRDQRLDARAGQSLLGCSGPPHSNLRQTEVVAIVSPLRSTEMELLQTKPLSL